MDESDIDQQNIENQSESHKSNSSSNFHKEFAEEVISKDFEDNHIPSNEEQADVLNQSHNELSRNYQRNEGVKEQVKSKDSSLDWGQNASNDNKSQSRDNHGIVEVHSQELQNAGEEKQRFEYIQRRPKVPEGYNQQPHLEYTQGFDTRNIGSLIRDSNPKENQTKNSERSGRVKFSQELAKSVETMRERDAFSNSDTIQERPQTRAQNDNKIRLRKKFIIKRKKSKSKNIIKNKKKWDDRFFIQPKESKIRDPVSILFRKFHGSKEGKGKNKQNKNQIAKHITNDTKESRESKMRTLRNEKFEKMWNNRFAVDERFLASSETRKFSKTMRPQSMINMKRQQGVPHTINDIAYKQEDNPKDEYNVIENPRTSRGVRPKTGEKKYWKVNSINEYGWSNNNVFANILRNHSNKKIDKYNQIKEKKWNQRFAIPISTYNESVFMSYRLSFDKI